MGIARKALKGALKFEKDMFGTTHDSDDGEFEEEENAPQQSSARRIQPVSIVVEDLPPEDLKAGDRIKYQDQTFVAGDTRA